MRRERERKRRGNIVASNKLTRIPGRSKGRAGGRKVPFLSKWQSQTCDRRSERKREKKGGRRPVLPETKANFNIKTPKPLWGRTDLAKEGGTIFSVYSNAKATKGGEGVEREREGR